MSFLKLYFRSPPAVIGLLLLLLVLAMAATADWLYPRDPLALAGRPLIWPFSRSSMAPASRCRSVWSRRSSR
jgi:peptide/nickel transport system permease protein